VLTPSLVPTPPGAPSLTGPLPAGHPEAAQLALAYLGVPYLWGGSTPTGFDCSGLVSYVYAQLGISLPHFAAAQWLYGAPVPVESLQPGDLVFFDKLDHVGIYLGDSLFIDAPHTGAFVRIDSLNTKWYQKKYVGARRI
jgi:cell wall-associated NlpC family hydrolase